MDRINYERKFVDSVEFCSRMVESWGNIKNNTRHRAFYQKDVDSIIKHIQNYAKANTKTALKSNIVQDMLKIKLSLFRMIDYFGYELIDDNGNEYYQTLDDPALVEVFNLLGFDNDIVNKQEFYHQWDLVQSEYNRITDNDSYTSYEEKYLNDNDARKPSRYVKVFLDENDITRIKDKYNLSSDINMQSLDFEEIVYDLINKSLS